MTQTDVTDPEGHIERTTFNADGYALTHVEALGTPVVVDVLCILLCGLVGHDGSVIAAAQGTDSTRPIVIFVDLSAKGLTYHVEGVPTSLGDMRRTLERKWDTSKDPDRQRKVVIVLHDSVTFARADDLRRFTLAAGYEPPRIFYFDKDHRLMFEVTYSVSMAFSPNGPGLEKR